MAEKNKKYASINCEIKIKERLEDRWTDWFEGLNLSYDRDGTTIITGSLPDQAALHSILLKIRDLNLTLVSVTQIESSPEDQS
jgi:hypothetical protein